jgi:hypothetical protein
MEKRYFFITTYDNLSASLITSILNTHSDVYCQASLHDALISYTNTFSYSETVDEFIRGNTHDTHLFEGNAQQYSSHELQNRILM